MVFSLPGYCKIQWKQSSVGTPDPFEISITSNTATIGIGGVSDGTNCVQAFITIPNLSPNGDSEIATGVGTQAFQSQVCGPNFGIASTNVPQTLNSKFLNSFFRDMLDVLLAKRKQLVIEGKTY